MQRWYDLKSIAESIQFDGTEDSLIWKFESKGVYYVSSLYAIVNFRGIMPVHISSVWKLKIPPRVHVFLWLLFYNKLLTRDNLHKRQEIPDLCCVFCSEEESIPHLFFVCVVARELWKKISMITKIRGQVTRVNSTNVLDEGLRIGGRATTRDSGIEIGTRCTQVHVPAVEDRYILLAI
jgi:hypothetical protein